MFCVTWLVGRYVHQYTKSAILKIIECILLQLLHSNVKVLYRSDNFVVINKDFDVRINSDDPFHILTVENQLRWKYPALADSQLGHSFRFVHRLDHATSGVLCIALNQRSARQASKLFQDRRVTKHYLALVRGHVKGWINHTYDVDMAIGRDVTEISTYKYCTPEVSNCREARGAQTRLVVLEYGMYEGHPVTKLLLIPKTGRSHQLRVHCASVGHVIVGDYIYSNRMDTAPYRMMLHAYRLIIPMQEEYLDICSDDPFVSSTDPKWQPQEVIHTYKDYLCNTQQSVKPGES